MCLNLHRAFCGEGVGRSMPRVAAFLMWLLCRQPIGGGVWDVLAALFRVEVEVWLLRFIYFFIYFLFI